MTQSRTAKVEFPEREDKTPNSRRKVPAHAVAVIVVSPGGTPNFKFTYTTRYEKFQTGIQKREEEYLKTLFSITHECQNNDVNTNI